MGQLALREDDWQGTKLCFSQALVISSEMGNTLGILEAVVGIAELLVAQSKFYLAASLAGWAQATIDGPNSTLSHSAMLDFASTVALTRSSLGNWAWEEATSCGKMWSTDQAIAAASLAIQSDT